MLGAVCDNALRFQWLRPLSGLFLKTPDPSDIPNPTTISPSQHRDIMLYSRCRWTAEPRWGPSSPQPWRSSPLRCQRCFHPSQFYHCGRKKKKKCVNSTSPSMLVWNIHRSEESELSYTCKMLWGNLFLFFFFLLKSWNRIHFTHNGMEPTIRARHQIQVHGCQCCFSGNNGCWCRMRQGRYSTGTKRRRVGMKVWGRTDDTKNDRGITLTVPTGLRHNGSRH